MSENVPTRDDKGAPLDLEQLTEMLMPSYRRDDPTVTDAEVERRTIRGGPHGAYVFVPAATQERIDDPTRDWPPGYPPELNYMSMRANYNVVVTWGYGLDFSGRPTVAEPELLSWLDSIRPQVERLLDSWRSGGEDDGLDRSA